MTYAQARDTGHVPNDEEKEKAFWGHILGGILDIVTGSMLLPIAAPVVISMMTKERGPFLMFHLNQSLWFRVAICGLQLVFLVIALVTCGVGAVLMPIPPLIGLIYSLIVGFAAK